ncbi:MAG: hypothetical protein K2Q29_12820 [Sphingomonadales bacterium]|jgi:general secretion pathway protein L|nr:hypothetical protein [Sphingomonadales bacterium]
MIRTGTILDMDMTSLGAALREGWDWWTGELAAMVPARWQTKERKLSGPRAAFDAEGALWLDGAALDPVAEGARRQLMPVVLPPAAAIATRSMLPRLAPRDLSRMVALELDRLLPFPPGTAIAGARALAEQAEPGHARVPTLVAGMPQARAAALVEAARTRGIEPLALLWQSPDDEALTIDLLPALVASGAITPRRDSRPFWWGLVAALFLANVGLMIWRDIAATSAFAAEVEAQATTGSAARALAGRLAREAALRRQLVAERDANDPLGLLALTTVALPEGAWVQRYVWTGESLRITGYKAPGSDIQTALRRTGRFASLQTSVSDPTAEGGGGQPFDVSATLAGAAKPKEGGQ